MEDKVSPDNSVCVLLGKWKPLVRLTLCPAAIDPNRARWAAGVFQLHRLAVLGSVKCPCDVDVNLFKRAPEIIHLLDSSQDSRAEICRLLFEYKVRLVVLYMCNRAISQYKSKVQGGLCFHGN